MSAEDRDAANSAADAAPGAAPSPLVIDEVIERSDAAGRARDAASAAARAENRTTTSRPKRRRIKARRVGLYVFLTTITLVWLVPFFVAVYEALRTNADVNQNGIFSIAQGLTLDNFISVWGQTTPTFPQAYLNTLVVTIPAVIIVLIVGSLVAYAISKYSWRINLVVLMVFTAGNLLPQQAIILPWFRFFLTPLFHIPEPFSDNGLLYNQYLGIIFIHVMFQLGFVVFVLSNYMKTLGKEVIEAALVDGASVLRIWGAIVMPLCKPAVAAMAALQFTFIYNDFFWGLLLMSTQDKRPITAALNTINGQYYSNYNALAAAALLAAVPTILVFLALQRYFVSGLSLGSVKG